MKYGRPVQFTAMGVTLAVLLTTSSPASPPDDNGSDPPAALGDCSVARDRFRDITALLSHWADRKRQLDDVPGLVLGLACGPAVTWSRGFGLADREAGLAATDTTPFRIASITKVFTALAVLQLRDEGRLGLDDPVSEHLSWFELENSVEMPAVTIRHLLTHTSGLPTNSAATDFNRMTQPTAEVARSVLPNQRLLFAPGTDENYSNLGFALLGQVVASVSDRSYRAYMAEEVFAPLGLEHTMAHPAPDLPQATGYHLRQPDRTRRPADFLHLAVFTPAGGMATTAADLVRFLAFVLAPDRTAGVIEPETLREMQRVHHWVDSARGGSGLAWAVEQRPGVHEVYHGGGLPTQASHLRVDLHRGFGVIVLANAEDADPAAYASEALALLRRASEAVPAREDHGQPRPSGDRHAPGKVGDVREGSPSAEGLERYTGRYRFHERELWIMELGAELLLISPLADRPSRTIVRLEPAGEHRFRLGGSVLGGGATGQTVEFVVEEPSGDVLRMHLPSLMLRRVGALRSG